MSPTARPGKVVPQPWYRNSQATGRSSVPQAGESPFMSLPPVETIRAHFPALSRTHGNRPVAYFDGPGGTQVPKAVVDAMQEYLFHRNANTHWVFPTSVETDRVRYQAREAMADFLGGAADEVVFGPNMTALTFHLSRALGRLLGPGDEILVTELDHHANVDPWRALEKERGVTLRVLPMLPDTGTLDLRRFPDLLGRRTRLVALGAASNALGTVTDVAPLCRMAREAGALVFVDAVHLAPHRRIRVGELDCHFLACSPYKFYGPHAGVLWIRQDLLNELDVPKLAPAPNRGPERWELGTLSHEAMAGTTAAVEFLAGLAKAGQGLGGPGPAPSEGPARGPSGGPVSLPPSRSHRLDLFFEALLSQEMALLDRLWKGLTAIPGVRVWGPPLSEPRTPTVAFTVRGLAAEEAASRLADEAAVFVSHGDFYATTAIARLGLAEQGVVRAGISLYTTPEEVDRLLEGVARLARGG